MRRLKTARSSLVLVAAAALLASGASPVGVATASASGAGCDDSASSAARVRNKNGVEPAQDPNAKAYGRIKTHPMMAPGSVTIPVRFNLISDHQVGAAEMTRWTTLVNNQITVLNDAYSGASAPGVAATSPFRFALQGGINFVDAPQWYDVVPGKAERDMKRRLYAGDSETLNVYAANIGGNLLGWAYFPQGFNNGRSYVDGVVILDESMPGGTAGKYAFGDTMTHEVGHWLALHHTFNNGCSASNDFVEDTPKEAIPQFDCPADSTDTCTAPGTDPIHNFMDYSEDSCMYMFTRGQAQRMNDAWIEFREVG